MEPVKQFVLILALCLSVQMSAISAPFVHVHADEGHETDHHRGRTAHRHAGNHDTTPPDHHGDTDTSHPQPGENGSTHVTGAEPGARFLGVTAARATTVTSLAGPVSAFSVFAQNSATLGLERVGPSRSTAPDISPPSLRGPPR